MKQLSAVLLRIEAIILVFPTFLGVMFLIGTSGLAWGSGKIIDPLMWTLVLLALVAAWWLILTYIYAGQQAAREAPAVIWLFAALVTLLAFLEVVVGFGDSPLQALAPGIVFVPTFVHLSAEVWLRRPNTSPA